jgi:hypothetical protein
MMRCRLLQRILDEELAAWCSHAEQRVYVLNGARERQRSCTYTTETRHVHLTWYPQELTIPSEWTIQRRQTVLVKQIARYRKCDVLFRRY